MPEQPDAAAGVPEDAHADPEFQRQLERVFQTAQEAGAPQPEPGVDFSPYEDESETFFIGREFTLEEFRRWFAVQRLGGRPYNAVGYHHTEYPRADVWWGTSSLDAVFNYYRDNLGWPAGKGPQLWVYSGDGSYSPGVPRIYVGTHPAHDGIGMDYRNGRWLHIEHIWNGDMAPFSDAMKRVSGEVLAIVCAPHPHANRQIPLRFLFDGGHNDPEEPLGILYHRDQNGINGVWPKSCPGYLVTHENLDADLVRYAGGGGGGPVVFTEDDVVAENGILVAARGAVARAKPERDDTGGRRLTESKRYKTKGYTDKGQDVAGSCRWFHLTGGDDWIHATGGIYQPRSGANPDFELEPRQLTVARARASVRPGPSRESGEQLRTLPPGSTHAVDGFTATGQAIAGSKRWYRLAGNAGWVHASGWSGAGSRLPRAGGEWATLDEMNDEIGSAAESTGVPPHLIKAMLSREGSFGRDWGRAPVWFEGRPSEVLPFNGIFRTTAENRGIDFDKMCQERPYAIWAMGEVLRQIKEQQGFQAWDDVAGYYFAGPDWNDPNWGDEVGSTVANYKYGPTGVITRMTHLDRLPT